MSKVSPVNNKMLNPGEGATVELVLKTAWYTRLSLFDTSCLRTPNPAAFSGPGWSSIYALYSTSIVPGLQRDHRLPQSISKLTASAAAGRRIRATQRELLV